MIVPNLTNDAFRRDPVGYEGSADGQIWPNPDTLPSADSELLVVGATKDIAHMARARAGRLVE
jgi:hypothetical protein